MPQIDVEPQLKQIEYIFKQRHQILSRSSLIERLHGLQILELIYRTQCNYVFFFIFDLFYLCMYYIVLDWVRLDAMVLASIVCG